VTTCAFYAGLFSNRGGIALDPCATVDDGRTCALEYNLSRAGASAAEAGFTVFVRGEGDRLAAARIYDDAGR
jgi:hypothetical protein